MPALSLAMARPASAIEAAECDAWRNGTLGVWCSRREKAHMPCGRKTGFTSQFGQDKGLWERFFKSWTTRGVYVDVAANHFKLGSNS